MNYNLKIEFLSFLRKTILNSLNIIQIPLLMTVLEIIFLTQRVIFIIISLLLINSPLLLMNILNLLMITKLFECLIFPLLLVIRLLILGNLVDDNSRKFWNLLVGILFSFHIGLLLRVQSQLQRVHLAVRNKLEFKVHWNKVQFGGEWIELNYF